MNSNGAGDVGLRESRRLTRLVAIVECLDLTVTAVILGTIATVVGGLIVAAALALPFPIVAYGTIALTAVGGLALTFAATVAP